MSSFNSASKIKQKEMQVCIERLLMKSMSTNRNAQTIADLT